MLRKNKSQQEKLGNESQEPVTESEVSIMAENIQNDLAITDKDNVSYATRITKDNQVMLSGYFIRLAGEETDSAKAVVERHVGPRGTAHFITTYDGESELASTAFLAVWNMPQ